ncbi:MAG: MerR family transcriptional regulator [Planctomyces sp.]|nr:MerR family transcriptional regulator [Planctomyces sp.]
MGEAAAILGVAQSAVRSWAEVGKIPMHKNTAIGYRLFNRSDLQRFLKCVERPTRPNEKQRE